jgi:hypothetical protein
MDGALRNGSGDSGLTVTGYPSYGWASLINYLIIVAILM